MCVAKGLPCPSSSVHVLSDGLGHRSYRLNVLSSMETRPYPRFPGPPDPTFPDSILEPRAGADGCQQRIEHPEGEERGGEGNMVG